MLKKSFKLELIYFKTNDGLKLKVYKNENLISFYNNLRVAEGRQWKTTPRGEISPGKLQWRG